MWDQLVISSDKETCWMCSCIKKKFTSLILLLLCGLCSSGSLTFQALWRVPVLLWGRLITQVEKKKQKNLSTCISLLNVVLYCHSGGRVNYNRKHYLQIWPVTCKKKKNSHIENLILDSFTLCEQKHCWPPTCFTEAETRRAGEGERAEPQ